MIKDYQSIINSLKLTLDLNLNHYPYITPNQDDLSGFIDSLLNSKIFDVNKEKYLICDIGFGLGLSLFNIKSQFEKTYIKSKSEYHGIENDSNLINIFNTTFKKFWKEIEVYETSCMSHNYSKYDIIYTYLIFKNENNLYDLYRKILNEMKIGSIIYEYYGNGLSQDNLLLKISNEFKNIQIKELYFGNYKKFIFTKIY